MARKVEVLLRDNVKDLGRCGDVVKVAPGYARNYLLPRRIAVTANEDNKRAMVRRRALLDAEEATRTAEIQARVASLSGIVVKTSGKADEGGQLYGSVNAGTIAALLAAQGHAFSEKDVRLDTPIKQVGTHTVKLHVHGEHFAEIQVVVEAEGAPAAAS
jgi:large subunit ribosomal protein L9